MTANLLFVCSRNKWRSPTAERIFSRNPDFAVRSGGTSPNAQRQVNQADIVWADVVFVMEHKHRSRLAAKFSRAMQYKTVHILDIPDDYAFMDPELVALFEQAVPLLLR